MQGAASPQAMEEEISETFALAKFRLAKGSQN
jgi:hypothetical protein